MTYVPIPCGIATNKYHEKAPPICQHVLIMISNASRENRQELLRRLHRGMENLRAKGEVEGIAWEVHKSMHLQEPDAQDIGRYLRAAKSGAEGGITSKIRTAAAQPYVDSILEVRTKPLPTKLKQEYEDVAATIENVMVQKPFVEGTAAKEFLPVLSARVADHY